MITIQEVLFTQQNLLVPYLETQMGVEHTGTLPWDLIDYVTYDVANPIVETIKCAGCGKHIEDYTHTKHNDYSSYGEFYCIPCFDKNPWL